MARFDELNNARSDLNLPGFECIVSVSHASDETQMTLRFPIYYMMMNWKETSEDEINSFAEDLKNKFLADLERGKNRLLQLHKIRNTNNG